MEAYSQPPSRRSRTFAIALFGAIAFVAACSTKVGENTNPPPTAVITPIGHKATSGAGTPSVAITARSGAAVILSGKDSDDNGVAITSFGWTQTGGPALPAPPDIGALLYQTSSTVEFTAPQVASDTVLTFKLTVTNALNQSSTASAAVTVTPANDPDEFLVASVVDNPTPPRRFVVAVATNRGLTPPLSADVPVCISVNRKLSYTSRDGTLHDGVHSPMLSLPPLASLHADAVWRAAVGGIGTTGEAAPFAAALQSSTNPRVVFDVPALNDVELAAMFNQPSVVGGVGTGIPAASLNQQLVPSDLDTAVMHLSITATPGSCDGKIPASSALQDTSLVLGVFAPGGTVPIMTNGGSGPLEQYGSNPTLACSSANSCSPLTADSLLIALNPPVAAAETLTSATNYYAKIDPGATKINLNDWLDANCFDHTQSDYGIGAAGVNGAHGVYTNNYDLGFGRDMYFIKCATNHTDGKGNITAHAGDMAAVVINYGSLEQTALKQAPILAVAMEYQGEGHTNGNCDSPSSTCFTKFYAFAPNDRDGSYQRVSSANFDQRGEKYIPGACLACHGGSVSDLKFTKTANVDASFMPWDLDALLYSDTDPAFNKELIDGQPAIISGTPYTRAAQEPNLEKLNALAWQTYQTPELKTLSAATTDCSTPPMASATCIDRFAAPKALLMKWYGWCGLNGPSCSTAHSYDDSKATSANDWPTTTPSGAPTTPTGAPNDLYHAVYAHHCRSCHTQSNVISKQFIDFKTFQSYIQGKVGSAANGIPNLAFHYARMPLARLTMDRFWVNFYGSTSAAQRLGEYINDPSTKASLPIAVNTAADAAGNTVESPGAPLLTASVYERVDTSGPVGVISSGGTNTYSLDRFGGARIDFSSSLFAANYQSAFTQMPSPPLVGADNGSPAFDTSTTGAYMLRVTATSASGKKTTPPPTYTFNVKATPPVISVKCQAISQSGAVNVPIDIDLSGCVTPGIEPTNGGYNALQIQQQPAGNNCQNASSNAWVGGTTSISDAGGTWTASLSSIDAYGVTLTFKASATANESVTLCFRITDFDGKDPLGSITFMVSDTLTAANPASPIKFTALAVPYTILATLLTKSDTIVPASDTGVTLVLTPSAATTLGGLISPPTIGLTGDFVYTPPAPTFLTCDINGNDVNTGASPCTYDTFAYYLLSGDGLVRSLSTATVSLNIQATTSFSRTLTSSDIYSILTTNCMSCHDVPSSAAANHWTYSSVAIDTYNSITDRSPNANTSGIDWTQNNVGGTYVGYSSSAALYDNVCDSSSTHYSTEFPGSGSAPEPSFCPTLLQWILEGAHDD